MENIVLFDGVCNFCDQSVQFIIKRDAIGFFKFASLQSDSGQNLLKKYHMPTDLDSFLFIQNGKVYTKSTAALQVARHLDGPWKFFYPLIIIPKPIRDLFYNIFARNRYKWFGQKDNCALPTQETRNRFLD